MSFQYRTLFLSDLHLGARASRPRAVLDFLRAHDAETIYLVGDVFDLWHGGKVHWSAAHDAVIAELERRAAGGTRIVYLAGNHDAALREPGAARLPEGWDLREALTHRAADGTRYLVLHGDQCDARVLRFQIMTRIGSRADAAVRALDAWVARRFGHAEPRPDTRLQRLISVFNALFVLGGRFERRLVALAKAADAQGVVCGHSHKPMIREVDGALFVNCGDWVDSFTAVAEMWDGALRLIEWAPETAPAPAPGNEMPALARSTR